MVKLSLGLEIQMKMPADLVSGEGSLLVPDWQHLVFSRGTSKKGCFCGSFFPLLNCGD